METSPVEFRQKLETIVIRFYKNGNRFADIIAPEATASCIAEELIKYGMDISLDIVPESDRNKLISYSRISDAFTRYRFPLESK